MDAEVLELWGSEEPKSKSAETTWPEIKSSRGLVEPPDVCIVCLEPLGLNTDVCLMQCSHAATCANCGLLLRYACHKNTCLVCSLPSETILVTRPKKFVFDCGGEREVYRVLLKFDRYFSRSEFSHSGWSGAAESKTTERTITTALTSSDEFQAFFTQPEVLSKFLAKVSLVCTFCHSKTAKRQTTAVKFTNIKSYVNHLEMIHSKFICDICLEHKRIFLHDHEIFTSYDDLCMHKIKGNDADQKGHPWCDWCTIHFFGPSELYAHFRKVHEPCRFCDQLSIPERIFKDVDCLELHVREEHFLCEHRSCRDNHCGFCESSEELEAHYKGNHAGIRPTGGRRLISRPKGPSYITLPGPHCISGTADGPDHIVPEEVVESDIPNLQDSSAFPSLAPAANEWQTVRSKKSNPRQRAWPELPSAPAPGKKSPKAKTRNATCR